MASDLIILARIIHAHLLQGPILCPAGLFSFGLLDGPQVRLRRPHVREAPAGLRGLSRFATAFMNNPGLALSGSLRSAVSLAEG
jgi:hypothetical protein